MSSSTDSPTLLLSASSLSVVALVLFVIFAALLAGVVFPLQPFSVAWQLRLAAALIRNSPLPLLGLALLHLGADLEPNDLSLLRRCRRCSQLAAPVAMAFLLLIPLQSQAALRQHSAVSSARIHRISVAERKLSELRQAVARASSGVELSRRLQALQGPSLSPAEIVAPLPVLKAHLDAVLDQSQLEIERERSGLPPSSRWILLPEMIRSTIASLALAAGFAALAVLPGGEISLLGELRSILRMPFTLLSQGLGSQSRKRQDLDYLGRIHSDEED